MNLKKAKKHLLKINRLYDNISEDGQLSQIERDLMLNYVREFYEIFLFDKNGSSPKTVAAPSPNAAKPAAISYKPIQKAKVEPKPVVKPIIKEVVVPPPAPEPVVKPVVKEVIAPTPPTPPRPEPIKIPEPLKVEVVPEPVKSKDEILIPKFVHAPKLKPKSDVANIRAEDDDIFAIKEATELSEKLSQTPIKDLNKAMGINDKIHLINELWGGNKIYFDEVIKELNGLPHFEAAQTYLSQNVAAKYDWSNKKRQKIAKDFIRLVKRRYN